MADYKFSAAEKFGVWNAHDGRCFWCEKPLEYPQTTVDHVIPESLKKDHAKLADVLEAFGLPNDFKVNDFPNWVPAHSNCNSKKGATVFRVSPAMVAALEYVLRRTPKAKATSERVQKDRKKGKILAQLEDAKTEGLVTKVDIENLFSEQPPEPVARPIKLQLSSHWTVVRQEERDIVYVTNGIVGGYTTTNPNPHHSYLCPFCNSPGPWNGVVCLTCNRISDPAD